MLTVLLSEKMEPFYQIVSSFPTVFFTIILIFSIFYWCFAVLGLVDIDFFDFNPETSNGIDSITDLNVMAGVLFKFGLNGVPLSIIGTLIAFIGWIISFLVCYFLFPLIPSGAISHLASTIAWFAILYISALTTAFIIKPIRPIFLATMQEGQKIILGQTAIVRTEKVDTSYGEVFLEDGGAGLIIKVRPYKDETFSKGDKVVLIEYNESSNIYKIVSEADFKN